MSELTNFGQATLVVQGVTPSGPSMNVTSIRVSNTVLSFDSTTGSITANVYDTNGTLIRLSRVPIQIQSASQPASVGPGDEWVCTSNSNVFKYTSTLGWGWLGGYTVPGTVYLFTSTSTQTVSAGTYNYFMIGGGGGGTGTHTGGGGAGYISTGTFTYAGGSLSVTVGGAGAGGPSNGLATVGGTTVINTGSSPSISGGGVAADAGGGPGGNGSSGGGGGGNAGAAGAGGSGGSNGAAGATQGGGTGQGTTLVTNAMTLLQTGLRTVYPSATVTAGAGGAAGNTSHSGGGGGGGIIITNVAGISSPNAGDGANSLSGKGGAGFGAAGGAGGYNGGNYYAGGSGAAGLVVIWQ